MSELKKYNYPESKPSRHGEYFVVVDDYKAVGIYDGRGFWADDKPLNVKYFFEPAASPVSDAVELVEYTKWVRENWIVGSNETWRRQADYRDRRTDNALVTEYKLSSTITKKQ